MKFGMIALIMAGLCFCTEAQSQMVRIKVIQNGSSAVQVRTAPKPAPVQLKEEPPVSYRVKSVVRNTPRKEIQKTKEIKRVWKDENIKARWTWPGYPSTAALRKHIKEEPHYKNADRLSNRQLIELHNREHDIMGPVNTKRSSPRKNVQPMRSRRLWGNPRFCPTGSS